MFFGLVLTDIYMVYLGSDNFALAINYVLETL